MIQQAAHTLRKQLTVRPEIGLILGSGLGELADEIQDPTVIPYEQIDGFPVSTVAGHEGCFVGGTLEGKRVLAMKGRIHYYEGYPMSQVVWPVYIMQELGVHTLVVTNAAGGINRSFRPGELMLIEDHLNMTGNNPLIGPNDEQRGPRFPDMSTAYDHSLRALARKVVPRVQAAFPNESFRVQEGVYAGVSGPNYCTPAELIMIARLGADAIGMSTVPEVIAARHAGLKVLGISCITDMAVGEELEVLTHEQVVAVAERTKPMFKRFVRFWLEELEVD